MVLLLHITIAIISIVVAGILIVRPSHSLIKVELGLTAGTIMSGVILVLQGASLLHLCMSGLLFTSLSTTAVVVANRRLRLAVSRATR